MKILLASSPFGGGGITTYAHELIRALSEENEVYVILKDDSKAPIDKSKATIVYCDCKDHSVSNAKKVLKIVNEDITPDLLIASGATLIPIIAPFIKNTIRVVTVSHSARYIHTDYSALNHEYIDRIIAASSIYNKEYLEKKFGINDKEKISVILNFVDDIEEAHELREKKKKDNIVKIVFVGACGGAKTPELAYKVAKGLIKTDWNFKFYWTGNTVIPLTKYFPFIKRKLVKDRIASDPRLVFTGRIPDKKDLDRLVAEANIFLAPSRREGCSMALVEATRDGSIAIVADYLNSNRVIVKDGESGFVIDHNKPEEFVRIIGDIINNNNKYSDFYDKARKVFESELTYKKWKEQIDECVINCLPRHKPRMASFDDGFFKKAARQYKRVYRWGKIHYFFQESLNVFLFMMFRTSKN